VMSFIRFGLQIIEQYMTCDLTNDKYRVLLAGTVVNWLKLLLKD